MAGDVTSLLDRWKRGDKVARDELSERVYAELRGVAAGLMRNERAGHTFQPTDLVHEAFVRLLRYEDLQAANRLQFFSLAATLMRRALVDHARARAANKRGAGATPVTLDTGTLFESAPPVDVLAVDAALAKLATMDDRQAKVVELKYFGGLSNDEVAVALGISRATVMRDWRSARAWLYGQLRR